MATNSYTAAGLTGGSTYLFKVQSRNVKGLSSLTSQISILCASVPLTPLAPTTAISSINVQIVWSKPDTGGSPITSYKIEIQISDGSYITDLTTCDGSSATIITNLSCNILISRLRGAPYNLPWGASIYAKVTANNIVGPSVTSNAGNNA